MAVLGQMKILEATQNQRKTYELAKWEMTETALVQGPPYQYRQARFRGVGVAVSIQVTRNDRVRVE